MHAKDVVHQLSTLNSELSALLILAYKLAEETRGALARIEPPEGPELREAGLRYLATVSNAQLRRDVIKARGERSAAHLRTRLNGDLEAIAGRRHPINGQARVVNGNGAHDAA